MKMQIRYSVVVFLMLLMAGATFAQGRLERGGSARGERLISALDLEDGQKVEVREIMDNFSKELRSSRNHTELEARKEAAVKAREEMHRQMKDVLTEEQYAKYQDLESEMRMRMEERRTERKARVEQKTQDMKLTEEQQSQLRAIRQDASQRRKDINNQELTVDQRREALKTLKKDIDKQVQDLLSEEQYKMYKDNEENRKKMRSEKRSLRSY